MDSEGRHDTARGAIVPVTTESDETRCTRRSLVRVVTAGAATVIAPEFVSVASGATASGNVELTTTATVPTDTSIDVTIYEDEDGDSTAERSQSQSISDGTDVVTEFDQLQGTESNTWTYWIDVSMSTTDTSVTPELDSMTITLPAETATATPAPSEPQVSEPGGSTLPLRVNFSDMQAGTSVFLVGILGGLFGVSYLFRNPAAGIATAFALVVLIMSGLFGLTLELFWLIIVAAAVLVVVGLAARWGT